jgi:gliding motility-associated-like protein
MNNKKTILFFSFIILCCLIGSAQLKADFEADTLAFCPPLAVKFKDISTGGRITSRQWSFGQGASSNSNDPFPSATYSNSGSYTVTLTVGDGSVTSTVTKTAFIKAFRVPQVNFNTSQTRKGCAPLKINYNDLTTIGDASIASYNWNLGNGTRSNLRNPTLSYGFPGIYTVALSVIDTNGCSSSDQKLRYIEAVPGAVAKFTTIGQASSCKGPHAVRFKSNSSGLAPLTHSWDFGNGATSTIADPTITFNTGSYDVTYIVTDVSGCSDTLKIKRFVTVGASKADFSTVSDTFCLSDSSPIEFTNLSVGANYYYWTFGNGVSGSSKNEFYSYPAVGTYKVKLVVSGGVGCTDSITKTITIIQPKATFTSNVNYWCSDTLIELTPKSDYQNEVSKIVWGIMEEKDTVIRKFGKYSIHKSEVGWHTDTMTVFYPKWGTCFSQQIKRTIRIWKPKGTANLSESQGCVPLIVTGTENLSPVDSLLVGVWKFSSGKTVSGKTASDTITIPGKYTVTYCVKLKRGCHYRFGPIEYKAGLKPKADFKVDTSAFCVGVEAQFTNLSTDSSKLDYYRWDLDFPNNATDTSRHPLKSYDDTSFKSIRLIVGHYGCLDTIIKKNFLEILGPIGSILTSIDCDFPYDRSFYPLKWADVQRFKYEFGDFVGIDTTNALANYNYASRGDYKLILTLINDSNNCEYEIEKLIRIRDIKLVSKIDKQLECFPYIYKFDASNSQDVVAVDVYMNNKTYYPLNYRRFNVKTDFKGVQQPMIVGYDEHGCTDTNYHWLKTYKPDAKIETSGDTGCGPFTVLFMDSTKYDTTAMKRTWYIYPFPTTNQVNPRIVFKSPGRYQVHLDVVDILGCTSETSKFIEVWQPLPRILVDTQICVGAPVLFTNIGSAPNETHTWSFGDSLVGVGPKAQIIYNKRGRKSIRLTSVDAHGCDSVLNKPLWVDVQEIDRPNIVSQPMDTNCYPAEIDFEDFNIDKIVKFRYWRFDSTESFFRLRGPLSFYNYNKPGVYGLDLIIESTYDCRDTFRFDSIVKIGGPYAEFDIMDTVCIFSEVGIEFKNKYEVFEFRMDFGDGNIDTVSGKSDSVYYRYSNPGFFPVNLIFIDSLKQCLRSWSDSVFVLQVESKIEHQDTAGCEPFELIVNAETTPANEYKWFVNEKLIENTQSFSRYFSKAGRHKLKLVPKNLLHGCTDSSFLDFEVFPKPIIETIGGGIFCDKDSVLMTAFGADYYLWSPNIYISRDTNDSVMVKPSENVTYTIIGKTIYGCLDTAFLDYKVVNAPEYVGIDDTTMFSGQKLQMNINEDPNLNYSWDPPLFLSCDNCANPVIDAQREITYTLSVSDRYGCFSYDTSFTVFLDDDYSIIMPNAFSPNGDDLNETFRFFTKGIKELIFFGIYNRWGEELYTFSDLNDEWDGVYRGNPWPTNSKLVYRGQFKKYNGDIVELTGFIVIVR